MKRLALIMIIVLVVISQVTGQINPELQRFSDLIGNGYGNIDLEVFTAFHGSNYEKVSLDNPYPNVDEKDEVWKLVYPGGEFYFYQFHRNGNIALILWVLTSEFDMPAPYESIFGLSLGEIRRRFGREHFWFSNSIASHGQSYGALRFHYTDKQKVYQISWAADFP